ncbi:hypothetical protein [Halobacteriovorax sp. HLS]|uniref:hypothetical protein n=1 Tax=Halobacteriovorax sp. HLS TaxID=2234000 RepID=UPI000FD898F1|nr:hypothetical protein [Halobacteriovorax sp. HLS]
MKGLLISVALLFGFNTFATCSNEALSEIGFKIESTKFHSNTKKVLNWLSHDEDFFVDDIETKFFSTQYGGYVQFNSYDHLSTPQMEMYGDIVVIRALSSDEVLEVRWYKNGIKHISYNAKKQGCASDLVPYADNALF